MKKFICIILLLNLVTGWSQTGSGTFTPRFNPLVKYEVKTTAGTRHIGYVVTETETQITLENRETNSSIQLFKNEISNVKEFRSKKEPVAEDPFEENHHAGAYMLTASAFEMKEGTAVANNHWIIFENLQYSLSDNWAITSNVLGILPLSAGLKCSYKIGQKSFLGFHGQAYGNVFESSGNSLLFGYSGLARYTYGTSNRNLTASAGVLGISSSFLNIQTTRRYINLPFASAAFCTRVNTYLAFVGEGWYFPGASSVIGGVGAKLVKNEISCWTFGCYSLLNANNGTLNIDYRNLLIPYIGVSRSFN